MPRRQTELSEDTVADLLAIGTAIRETRKGRFSLEALARAAGVSTGVLSQLENGSANPTIDVLERIAKALEVELGDIISPPEARPTELVRAGERHRQRVFDTSQDVDLLTAGLRRSFTVTYVVLTPGESMVNQHEFSGESLIHLVSGVYRVATSRGLVHMAEGDSLWAPSSSLLRFENPHDSLESHAVSVYLPVQES